jgi:hypothetical protein
MEAALDSKIDEERVTETRPRVKEAQRWTGRLDGDRHPILNAMLAVSNRVVWIADGRI